MLASACLLIAGLGQQFQFPVIDSFLYTGYSFRNVFCILVQPAVQKELNLSDRQFGEIKAELGNMVTWKGYEPRAISLGEDRDYTQIDSKLVIYLNNDQRQRLSELWLQQVGAWALQSDSLADSLHMTRKQRHDIYDVELDLKEEMKDWSQAADSANNRFNEQLLKDSQKRMLEVLTPEQTQAFKTLQGKPFDWTKAFPYARKTAGG